MYFSIFRKKSKEIELYFYILIGALKDTKIRCNIMA